MSGSKPLCTAISALILAVAAVSPSGCAVYRKCGLDGCPGDAHITAEVTARFNHYAELEPPNLVYVQTLDRVVYLTGQVNTETERDLAKTVAQQVPGVTRVVNSINTGYQGR
jgi:osmotically-inducible protein OsmY